MAARSASEKPSDAAAARTPSQACSKVEPSVQKLALASNQASPALRTLAWVAAPSGLPLARRRADRQKALFMTPLEKWTSSPSKKSAALSIEAPSAVGSHMKRRAS